MSQFSGRTDITYKNERKRRRRGCGNIDVEMILTLTPNHDSLLLSMLEEVLPNPYFQRDLREKERSTEVLIFLIEVYAC